jgi:hypothetical protein
VDYVTQKMDLDFAAHINFLEMMICFPRYQYSFEMGAKFFITHLKFDFIDQKCSVKYA